MVGYAPSIEFSYDRYTNTPVHDKLLKIHDGELLGNDTHVDIVTVDLFTEDDSKRGFAVKRTYEVIPKSPMETVMDMP